MLLQDRYQLVEQLGEGGMGVVWRGFDRDLEEWVAIKFLRESLADDAALRGLFRREVRLARRVTHPNVARVYEFGRDGDLCFLTMEFIPGESLQAELAREGRLAPMQVYRRAVGLCRGLAAAHEAGVVHGDLKPANMLLATGRGVVLTDFGIARALSESLTPDELGRGTPVYMAPEQIVGEPITPCSDVYSAGVLLFEALTGAVPWAAVDVISLLTEKSSGRALELEAIAPSMPEPWRRLLGACMHNDPKQRPQDGRALLGMLGALHRGEQPLPAVAAPPSALPVAPGRVGPKWLELAAGIAEEEGQLAALDWGTGDQVDALTQVARSRVAREPLQSSTRAALAPTIAAAVQPRDRSPTR